LINLKNMDIRSQRNLINCVKCARRRKVTQFKDVHLSKAEIYTYLAWQDEPGKPFGIAITVHTLQFLTPNISTDFIGGYSCFTPSGLEIFKEVPTPKGLNVNSHR
jgi:hypothetical protein